MFIVLIKSECEGRFAIHFGYRFELWCQGHQQGTESHQAIEAVLFTHHSGLALQHGWPGAGLVGPCRLPAIPIYHRQSHGTNKLSRAF